MKRIIALLLALVLCFGAIPFFGIEASAATSSAVANAVSNRLPLVTYAMPLSGASKVYSFVDDNYNDKTTKYYIDTFKDQIVITQISTDGKAVCVTYPSSSSSTGYRSRWFATDDILGLATVDIRPYTCSSDNSTYRMSSASAVTSYGSISKNDSCVMLGNHTVGGTTYYPTIYPISSGTYNKVSGVRNKLALGRFAPAKVQPIPNGKYIIVSSLNNNMVLDVSNGSKDNCANIQLWTRNGSGAQIFTATYNNGGWYTIVNAQSGKALDVANGEAKCGQNVQQYQTNGTNAQKWYLEDAGGSYFYIRSALGYYLDANGGVANNGTNIQIWTGNKSNAQKFKFEAFSSMDATQKAVQSRLDEIANGTRSYNDSTVMKVGSKFTGYRSGEQCKGYAKNVFYICFKIQPGSTQGNNYLLNATTGMTEVGRVTNQDTQSLAKLFTKARPGDFVQMRRTHGGPHSAIIYCVTATGVTFLEANTDSKNTVMLNTYSWADLAAKNNAMTLYTATTYALK